MAGLSSEDIPFSFKEATSKTYVFDGPASGPAGSFSAQSSGPDSDQIYRLARAAELGWPPVAERVVAEAQKVMRDGGVAAAAWQRPPLGSAVVIAPGQGVACEAGTAVAFAPWIETAFA